MNSSTTQTSVEAGNQRRASASNSDEEEWSGVVECAVLERSKSDRAVRASEDRRRRTIIVEKKNGTYGFTLQSYGIHYKKEQEIEMVTYVDYVEYDGPAFKAGMREGDVILSINGHEMDRADHKTLVNFIKNCDARMRMVVSFEDCVRKVELHMRYIELQRALQSRLAELERLCEREKSILMGRWKTHSLPARKRTPNVIIAGNASQPFSSSTFNSSTIQCCRPATSTEHLLLYSVFSDGRPCFIPRSAACLVAVGPPRSRSDHHHLLSKMPNDTPTNSLSRHSYHHSNGGMGSTSSGTPAKSKSHKSTSSGETGNAGGNNAGALHATAQNNLCVACISSATRRRDQSDNGSLDAYDLASPCCDPNCVPSRRRREKQRRIRSEQNAQQNMQQQQQQMHHHKHESKVRAQNLQQQHNCSRASGHSLHSITSSDMSGADSGASCSTSLSTDTLYWEPSLHQRPPACLQYAKPKSWDNLTTKSYGGYGFGYGYMDTGTIKTHSVERGSTKSYSQSRAKTPTGTIQRRTGSYQSTSTRHFQPTKSTESLLVSHRYQSINHSDHDSTSISCECLEGPNQRFVIQSVSTEKHGKRQDDPNYIQARHRRASHSDSKLKTANNSEVTRL